MPLIEDFFRNRVLFAAGLAWLLAQVFKVLITLIISKKFTPERLWGAGGMPSAHSAMALRADGVHRAIQRRQFRRFRPGGDVRLRHHVRCDGRPAGRRGSTRGC